jgi:hypothetical protein
VKINLLHLEKGFKKYELTTLDQTTCSDLELEHILMLMANKDQFIYESVKQVIFSEAISIEDVYFRQDIIRDFQENPELLDEIYRLITLTMKKKRENWWGVSSRYMASRMSSALNILGLFSGSLRDVRDLMRKHASNIKSKGLLKLYNLLEEELTDDYLKKLHDQISDLRFEKGVMIKAEVGDNNYSVNYKLVKPFSKRFEGTKWYFTPGFQLEPRDERGFEDLAKRKERALQPVVDALVDAAENMTDFFEAFHFEISFYMGCKNLLQYLSKNDVDVTYPILDSASDKFKFADLKDIALIMNEKNVVGTSLDVVDENLYLITGANQGGKTTFLRSIGQSILMMRSGMFVVASEYSYRHVNHLFTHFKKEEDKALESGKFEEELRRMKMIVEMINHGDIVLMNESFSSTNEQEGSEIASHIIKALVNNGIGIFVVTHFYKLSNMLLSDRNLVSLVAQRLDDGKRTFKIVEGSPLETSFGKDIYNQVFKID